MHVYSSCIQIILKVIFRYINSISKQHYMYKLFLLAFLLPATLFSQNWHLSFRAGMSNYQGDLKQNNFSFKQVKFVGSLGVRYDVTEHLLLRSHFSLGSLQADDAKNKRSSLKSRNLSFQTKLFEWELGAQYNIFSLNDKWWTPYVFAGGALFHFKPTALNNAGNRVDLKPLSTEGQGFISGKKNYRLTQFAIPFGIGGEYALNEDMRVGIELGYRKTFTDYIDDVSTTYVDPALLLSARGQQAVDMAYRGSGTYPATGTLRGNEKNKDSYYFLQLTFVWRPFVDWYERTSGLASFKKSKKVGCPGTRVKGY